MRPLPPLVRLALALVRAVSVLVPRRDRDRWRREWTGEILHQHQADARARVPPLDARLSLLRRALGTLPDAAWIRRQVTRDNEIVHDLRHAFRLLRAQPAFALLAVLILAIGIGSATAVFTVADRVLRRPLPYPDPDALVAIWQHDASLPDVVRGEVAPGNFLDWRARATSFDTMAAAEPYSVDYTGGERPEVWFATNVSERFFDVLRVTPLLGRTFTAEDHVAGRNHVVVISEALWRRRFDADAMVVGRTVPLDGQPYTIVGVLPGTFELGLLDAPGSRDAWLPKVFGPEERESRGSGWWAAIGRLAPGVTMAAAQADLDRVSRDLARAHPRTNRSTTARVEPLGEHLVADTRLAIRLVAAAVLAVLLIACANVANMLLARTADRHREFAIRRALGAGRGRLVRQLLAEAGLLAALGSAVGAGVAAWLVEVAAALAPRGMTRLASMTLDPGLLAIAAAAGVVATLAAGVVPAWQQSRQGQGDAPGSDRGGTGSRHARLVGDGLAVVEIALAVALAVGASLLLRSFTRLVDVDAGFRRDHVLAMQVFAWDRQDTAERRAAFFRDTLDDLRVLPGVVDAGIVSAMPLIDANISIETTFAVEGRPPKPPGEDDTASLTICSPAYFGVMRIPVTAGRPFLDTDSAASEPVAMISEALARRHWPGGGAVGAVIQVRAGGRARRLRVVGVTEGLRHDGLDLPARPEVFMPHAQYPFGSMTYVIRTAGDPSRLEGPAREAIWRQDPLMTFYETTTVERLVARSVAPRRFSLVLVGVFAGASLVLAAAGIYGVLSFSTRRRAREFGIRLALGARPREISRLVLARGLTLGAIGLAAGLPLAVGAGHALRSVLFGISPADPPTLAAVSALALAVSVAACYLPARRARQVDPVVALRD